MFTLTTKKYKAKIVLAGFQKVILEVKGEPLALGSNNFVKLLYIGFRLFPLAEKPVFWGTVGGLPKKRREC